MTDSNAQELERCPFCGSEAELDRRQGFRHYRTGQSLDQVSIYCTSCSANISHYPGDLDCDRDATAELCIASWNARTPAPAPLWQGRSPRRAQDGPDPAMTQDIFLIYTRAENGVIGREGALPWRIPADLKRFKALTMGKPMIMGRKTFDSFPAPLPGRRHIVLTRDTAWQAAGAEPVQSVEQALALAGDGAVAVIGGAEIYALFVPRADRVELTEVHARYDGDTIMPALDRAWHESARENHPATDKTPAYSFVTLTRALAALQAQPTASTAQGDDVVERISRAVHEFLCRRDIMQYLDNDEDCEGIARAALAALQSKPTDEGASG